MVEDLELIRTRSKSLTRQSCALFDCVITIINGYSFSLPLSPSLFVSLSLSLKVFFCVYVYKIVLCVFMYPYMCIHFEVFVFSSFPSFS